MKIKTFICTKINQEHLKNVEKEVNAFTAKHKVVDIKVNTTSNNYGAVVVYTVIYEGEE